MGILSWVDRVFFGGKRDFTVFDDKPKRFTVEDLQAIMNAKLLSAEKELLKSSQWIVDLIEEKVVKGDFEVIDLKRFENSTYFPAFLSSAKGIELQIVVYYPPSDLSIVHRLLRESVYDWSYITINPGSVFTIILVPANSIDWNETRTAKGWIYPEIKWKDPSNVFEPFPKSESLDFPQDSQI